jgi:hypothetical protein
MNLSTTTQERLSRFAAMNGYSSPEVIDTSVSLTIRTHKGVIGFEFNCEKREMFHTVLVCRMSDHGWPSGYYVGESGRTVRVYLQALLPGFSPRKPRRKRRTSQLDYNWEAQLTELESQLHEVERKAAEYFDLR